MITAWHRDEATKVVVNWLTAKEPKIGQLVWDRSEGDPGQAFEAAWGFINEGATQGNPSAEKVYFFLLNLIPDGKGHLLVDEDRVAAGLRAAFGTSSR